MSKKKTKTIRQKIGEVRDAALDYHRKSPPGKLSIHSTKPLANQHDLALAYSPGVAAACEEIVRDPAQASMLTTRGNLVAVISNGTAVLGLGPIGPLASKPVMEGKAVLFKKFSGIDVFDLELNETDPDKLVDIIASLEPTFGAINLEDIKSPECFIVERKLQERLSIPVIHDDQHGTAIIVAAAITNGLEMHADAAISETIRANAFPNSKLRGRANTLILPNIDAANISFNLLKMLGGGVTVGPLLVGAARPAHILTNASTVRGIVNMSALAVVEAQSRIRA